MYRCSIHSTSFSNYIIIYIKYKVKYFLNNF
nr:MAG TPA: hypothetical protein [Caudoviricetes sp.]